MTCEPLRISSLTKEYVRVPVAAREGSDDVDPTATTVVMAFTLDGAEPSSWQTASWETDADTDPDTYYARCLIGPGGTITLTEGSYTVWVKVTDSPEIPVMRAETEEGTPALLVIY